MVTHSPSPSSQTMSRSSKKEGELMLFSKRWPQRWLLIVSMVSALMLAIGSGIALSANFDTYYCGTASSTCTLGSGSPVSTVSTALRDNNTVWCISSCHTHVWYDAGQGGGAYYITHTNGGQSVSINIGSGGYAYSKCETDSGYGTNQAECDTTWHT